MFCCLFLFLFCCLILTNFLLYYVFYGGAEIKDTDTDTFFCFHCSIQIVIGTSLRHRNCLLCLTLLFFVYLFSIFITYFVPCFLCLFFFFYALLNFLIPPPCLPVFLFVSQMSFPVQFQLFFLAFLLFCPTHQVTPPCLPESWSPLVQSLLDSLSPSVSTIVSLAFFFFTIKAILHTAIRCCFATHSFTITLQSHISFKFLLLHIT